jgi:glycine cleavage system H protein
MIVPEDLRYTTDHEWARPDGRRVRVGITDYAQDALGAIVFVDLPNIGKEVEAGALLGEVESTKSVSELYSPVTGRVAEVNTALADAPEHLNDDPYGEGWICEIDLAEDGSLDALLDAAGYRQLIET